VGFDFLVVADVLLYALALMLELGALVWLRGREPALRGAFRLPMGRGGVAALAALPAALLILVVSLTLREPGYGAMSVVAAVGAAALGPLLYGLSTKRRARERTSAPE
jgi:hypothetical protein